MYIISFAMNNIDLTNYFGAKLILDVSHFVATARDIDSFMILNQLYLILVLTQIKT